MDEIRRLLAELDTEGQNSPNLAADLERQITEKVREYLAQPTTVAALIPKAIVTGDGHIQCPTCGSVDTIQEIDRGDRYNTLAIVQDEDGTQRVVAYLGSQADWETAGFYCPGCDSDVDFPLEIDEWR